MKDKQYHRKVLLSSFHLNGHTSGFYPQAQKLEPPYTEFLASTTLQHNKHHQRKVLLSSFHLNGHTLRFHPQNQNVRSTLHSIINSTTVYTVVLLSSFHLNTPRFKVQTMLCYDMLCYIK